MNRQPARLAAASAQRYEQVHDDGAVLGFVDYYHFPNAASPAQTALVIVTHTEVTGQVEGRGHGSRLVAAALAHFAGMPAQVVPICGFFASFLRKHPEHAAQATPTARALFKL